MAQTPIEWTDHSINPFRARDKETGAVGHFCVKISPGCAKCYASRMQARFQMHEFVAKNRDKVELFLDESKLEEVIRRKKPTKYFWCNMTDMFLDDYPDSWIIKCFDTMRATPQHTHQILTKRSERMADFSQRLRFDGAERGRMWLTSNPDGPGYRIMGGNGCTGMTWVWLGVSVENEDTIKRVDDLCKTPASVRFVSYEPALGPINIHPYLCNCEGRLEACCYPKPRINWVIAGGESGARARSSDIEYIRNVIDQCARHGVACFVKQLGKYPSDDPYGYNNGGAVWENPDTLDDGGPLLKHPKGGDPNEWPEDLRVQDMPRVNQ